jgi:hypothetical protein
VLVHVPAWQVHPFVPWHAVPSGSTGFEQIPVPGSHVPTAWQSSSAVQVTPAQRPIELPVDVPPPEELWPDPPVLALLLEAAPPVAPLLLDASPPLPPPLVDEELALDALLAPVELAPVVRGPAPDEAQATSPTTTHGLARLTKRTTPPGGSDIVTHPHRDEPRARQIGSP